MSGCPRCSGTGWCQVDATYDYDGNQRTEPWAYRCPAYHPKAPRSDERNEG